MSLFEVYPLYDIEIEKGEGSLIWDSKGQEYLDLYGGHAVISIGHSHPYYVQKLVSQIRKIGFYSNSIRIPGQIELSEKLEAISGKKDFKLFLCNSGAEANENALKLASFHNGRKKIIAFKGSFHGRTSLAVAATDNPKIQAPVNENENIIFLPLNDQEALENAFKTHSISSVIIEGIQGVGGIQISKPEFLKKIRSLCDHYGAVYIADSVQCGYGRTGQFFAHDIAGVDADMYTMAKGMGNGFPIAGVWISPKFEARYGMLGTTFGGNHLACAAGIAVLDTFLQENLMENAQELGKYWMNSISHIPGIKEVRGRGLMIGIEFHEKGAEIRNQILHQYKIFTGSSDNKNTVRLLPALNLSKDYADRFTHALKAIMEELNPLKK